MSDELVQRLQRALDFWMPAIAGGDGPDSERAASDAALLIGLEKYEADCYGDRMLDEIDRLRAEVERLDHGWNESIQVANGYAEQLGLAESALAALRKRVDEAPTSNIISGVFGIAAVAATMPGDLVGKRVALVVLD